uniref:leukocyte-associated immunoglobulin-like receptor 1 n=1 Tax=Jaculus jaculus TaxID=51337 RepID=UPI001E1B0C0C
QEELPNPSILAEPSTLIPRGEACQPGLKTERLYLLLGLSVAFLLCFLLLFWLLQKQQDSVQTSAAGGPQEVTYAQLDHRVLTQKASPTSVSPQGEETTAESSMYATLARR